jgi:hypothetical protein
MTPRTTITKAFAVGLLGSAVCLFAQSPQTSQTQVPEQTPAQPVAPPSNDATSQTAAPSGETLAGAGIPAAPIPPPAATSGHYVKDSKGKETYVGPNTVAILPPTPMLDGEGKQRVDPDGNLMFNTPIQQMRDKKGHPVFDGTGKPVFQTASDLGFDDKGKKIVAKKEKPPKMTPVSIAAGTLTVDGWTGKARLNYDIADLKFMYIYAPGIGITVVSQTPFPGAKEQPAAFNQQTLKITVDGHPIELYSEKPLLGKKPLSAWVSVDRGFQLPSKFPAFGYGTTIKSPYAWPGAKDTLAKGAVAPPPLPTDLRPTLLLAPCSAGMMRRAAPPALPGEKVPDQPCVPIKPQAPVVASPATATAAVPTASMVTAQSMPR